MRVHLHLFALWKKWAKKLWINTILWPISWIFTVLDILYELFNATDTVVYSDQAMHAQSHLRADIADSRPFPW